MNTEKRTTSFSNLNVPLSAGTAPPVSPLPPSPNMAPVSPTTSGAWSKNSTLSPTMDKNDKQRKKRFSFFNIFASKPKEASRSIDEPDETPISPAFSPPLSASLSASPPSIPPLAPFNPTNNVSLAVADSELKRLENTASIARLMAEITLPPLEDAAKSFQTPVEEDPYKPDIPKTELNDQTLLLESLNLNDDCESALASPSSVIFNGPFSPVLPAQPEDMETVKRISSVKKKNRESVADIFAGDMKNTVKRVSQDDKSGSNVKSGGFWDIFASPKDIETFSETRSNFSDEMEDLVEEGTMKFTQQKSMRKRSLGFLDRRRSLHQRAESEVTVSQNDSRNKVPARPSSSSATISRFSPDLANWDSIESVQTIGKAKAMKINAKRAIPALQQSFSHKETTETEPPQVRARSVTTPMPTIVVPGGNSDPELMYEEDEEAIEEEAKKAEEMLAEGRAKELSKSLYKEDLSAPVKRDEMCEWLGKRDPWRARVLKHYLDNFDFAGMKLEEAFRRFCNQLHLKGETQVIDRILQEFARRFHECNEHNSIFENQDVVYGVVYSILLLNTDLHVAQGNTKMQRTTFVRNTLATIAAYSSLPSSSKLSMEECDNKSIGGKSAVSNHSQKDLNSVLKEIYASIKSRSLSQPRSLEAQQQPIRSTTLNSYGSTLRSPNPSSFHISRSRSAGGIKRISSFTVSSPASPNTVDTVVSSPGSSKKRSIVSMSAASQYSEASFTTYGESVPPSPTLRAVINASMRIEDMEDPAGVFNKSGVLSRKHLYEKTDKKAQNRAWKECYALLDRGELKMYKLEKGGTDGSELQDINLQLGAMSLRHGLAVLLPPPGYSATRPHVLALQLPNGGVYLFQASSGEMAKDWVGACNYWAARESKEPMAGGIDNREYGWGRPTVNEDDSAEEVKREIIVAEWNPPPVSMLRSSYDDNNQLRALLSHIAKLENDLLDHKELRENLNRWPAKSPNYIRAFGNWERKSQWLLRELIKYQTYADCLKQVIISRHSPGEEGILPPSLDNSGDS